jgi:hypothetical protein
MAVLLGSGLRVSEALGVDREQYTGKGFARVQVKGGGVRDFVPLYRDARMVLDQTPPDLVVKLQPLDIAVVIFRLVLRLHFMYQRQIEG